MPSERPVIIAGGGPVGVVTALALARQGLEVRLFEAGASVDDGPRAATTHAATLEMLEALGVVEEVTRKQLNLLLDLIPKAMRVAYLSGPSSAPVFEDLKSNMLSAANALGREMIVLPADSDADFEAVFTTLVERDASALIVGSFSSLGQRRSSQRIIELAARHKIPTMYPNRGYALGGGLMSYSADPMAVSRQLGLDYVARVLKGTKPADLPVQQPTKFELVINLKTAKALGLTIPETLLATADEVIQ